MQKLRKKPKYSIVIDAAVLVSGSLFYAIAFEAFIEPSNLVLGGATGVATLLYGTLGIPVGVGILMVNFPLFLWNTVRHGFSHTFRMGIGVLISSLSLVLFSSLVPIPVSSLAGAVFGGLLSALGIALLLSREFTTGGSELAAVLIRERFSVLTVGKTVLLLDTAIVFLSVVLLGRIENLFYSALLNLVFAVVLDLICGAQKTPNIDNNSL